MARDKLARALALRIKVTGLMTASAFAAFAVALPLAAASVAATEVPKVVLDAATHIASRGYMAPAKGCRLVQQPGYEGLPTRRCAYRQGKLRAEVVLLGPDGPTLARQVSFACEGLIPANVPITHCALALLQRVGQQSSGHFPVAGVVLENGGAYAFRDGVTVHIGAFKNGTTTQLSAEQIEQSMSAPIRAWGRFARLQGSSFEDYRRFGRLTDGNGKLVDDSAMTYPELVGTRWRSEWDKDFNSLMRAWACANRKALATTQMACVEMPAAAPGAARNMPSR
ncbi:MAG: hypothetical protein AB7U92_01020 [Piscinibacter sp.]|uniref:hypothetical protein n=1 Tax=Piscinibacter sp. TaxID=1903157 RepID=UPI003D1356C0